MWGEDLMQERVFKCTLKSLFILAKGHTEDRGRKKKEEEERIDYEEERKTNNILLT